MQGARIVLFNLLAVGFLLVFIEGASSTLLALERIVGKSRLEARVAERVHTTYDPLLGWMNRTALSIPDMYGPGIGLTTNSQGFRGPDDFPPSVPRGKLRLICSGDSFTLGYGVSDDETWCAQLGALDPRLETVNMGQGGYGVDQAYLWYKRDARKLDHDIHVFAVSTTDFHRMRNDRFLGYGKPVLAIEGGELKVENVPVPRRRLRGLSRSLEAFATARLALRARRLVLGGPEARAPGDAELVRIALRILDEVQRLNRRRGSLPVLVYLPVRDDFGSLSSDSWRRMLARQSAERNLLFVDLVEALRAVPAAEVPKLFIQEQIKEYPYSAGHYTQLGNRFVAERIYAAITSHPSLARRLQSARAR